MKLSARVVAVPVVVLAGVLLGVMPTLAPSPGDEVSVDRAIDHVEFIAREPHPIGTPEIARVRDYLLATLLDMGLEPETQTAAAPDYFGPGGGTVEITNVMARIAGTDRNDALVLVAHYDTTPSTPGANDNAAAVAALLETGRILAGDPPPSDVILLFTDGEEPTPRFGASAFTDHRWFRDVRLAVNFEGIGVSGPSVLVEMNGPSAALADRLARSASSAVMFSSLTKTTEIIGGAATDFDVFSDRGVPGYNFAYLRGSSIYHTGRDVLSSLNVDGMAHHASLAVNLARDPGSLDFDDTGGEAVFFTVPGRVVIRYGSGAAAAGALIAVVVLVWVLMGRDRRMSSLGRLTAGAGLALGGGLAWTVATTVLWLGIVALRGTMGVIESYLWLLVLAACVAGGWYLLWRLSQRYEAEVAGGVALVWGLSALLTGVWLPPMSYIFVWPALAAGLGLAVRQRTRSAVGHLTGLTIVVLPTAVVLLPVIDTFFQLATPRPGNPDSELPASIAAPLLLVFLAIALIHATSHPYAERGKPAAGEPAPHQRGATIA